MNSKHFCSFEYSNKALLLEAIIQLTINKRKLLVNGEELLVKFFGASDFGLTSKMFQNYFQLSLSSSRFFRQKLSVPNFSLCSFSVAKQNFKVIPPSLSHKASKDFRVRFHF